MLAWRSPFAQPDNEPGYELGCARAREATAEHVDYPSLWGSPTLPVKPSPDDNKVQLAPDKYDVATEELALTMLAAKRQRQR